MKRVDVHRAWGPDDGRFSDWVKPVLFAAVEDDRAVSPLPDVGSPLVDAFARKVLGPIANAPVATTDDVRRVERPHAGDDATLPSASVSWATRAAPSGVEISDIALVVDVPGRRSAALGVGLVSVGFRPIPLFNSAPGAPGHELVETSRIIDVLVAGAATVALAPLLAPPAFLVDSTRLAAVARADIGNLDNRAVCRIVDFPSADTLASAGIRHVVHVSATPPAADLARVFDVWQAAGFRLWRVAADDDAEARAVLAPRFPILRAVARLISWRPDIRARPDGAFGRIIDEPGAG